MHFQVKIQLKIYKNFNSNNNSYLSCSNSNDPLNILHECCDTNLLMIPFNYMSTKRGGPDPLDLPLEVGADSQLYGIYIERQNQWRKRQ